MVDFQGCRYTTRILSDQRNYRQKHDKINKMRLILMKTFFIGRKQLRAYSLGLIAKVLAISCLLTILALQLLIKLTNRIGKNDIDRISGKHYGSEKSQRADRYNERK
jgi:hypothetical protein